MQFGDHFDTRETAPGHDECQQPRPQLAIALRLRLLEYADKMVSQREGVAVRLEGHRVLGQAGQAPEIRHVAQREDEMIEGQDERPRPESRRADHAAVHEIDALDVAHVQPHAGDEAADRRGRVGDAHAAGDHLGQHGLKDQVVLAVDEVDLHAPAGSAEQFAGGVRARKSAAEDDDARGVGHDPVL